MFIFAISSNVIKLDKILDFERILAFRDVLIYEDLFTQACSLYIKYVNIFSTIAREEFKNMLQFV